jgi:hypothetical protein
MGVGIVKSDLVISAIFLMRALQHGPRDAVIEKDERNERGHEGFWQMAIHNLSFWRARNYATGFHGLIKGIGRKFSYHWESRPTAFSNLRKNHGKRLVSSDYTIRTI